MENLTVCVQRYKEPEIIKRFSKDDLMRIINRYEVEIAKKIISHAVDEGAASVQLELITAEDFKNT